MTQIPDIDAAFEEWLAASEPCPPPDQDETALPYRRFGHVRAVLEKESCLLILCRLYTEPDHRGRGEANALLKWLTGLCERHGVTLLGQARVSEGNGLAQQALLRWYADKGFEVDDRTAARPLVWYPRRPR